MSSVLKKFSRIGYGTARCSVNNQSNLEAISKALKSNCITVFDTAANYGSGSSERLIGKVTSEADYDHISICSKFGYFQIAPEKSGAFPQSFPVAPGHSYCMHPDFMHHQLNGSLERLNKRKIDVYSVHNPEHLLHQIASEIGQKTANSLADGDQTPKDKPIEVPWAQIQPEVEGIFFEKMVDVFMALEERIAEGSISAYGVSSNALGAPSAPGAAQLRWEPLVEAAQAAARTMGREQPGLAVFALPVNVLEPGGLAAAAALWARGYRTVGHRPLTALWDDKVWRLVDKGAANAPQMYLDASRDILEHFTFPMPEGREPTDEEKETAEGCKVLRELIQDLNQRLSSFSSVLHYDDYLSYKVVPQIADKFAELDGDSSDKLKAFFETYGTLVRFNCTQTTRQLLAGEGCPGGPHLLQEGQSLQDFALRWLLAEGRGKLDTVLVGLPQGRHVDAALALLGDEEGEGEG
mmetsp:Transcript_11505/g.20499  ORF Transcript_11505/g.20499 Transcript_11505/m.20499 type:complete len:466 (-) Transcript_11505:19-1416(-)